MNHRNDVKSVPSDPNSNPDPVAIVSGSGSGFAVVSEESHKCDTFGVTESEKAGSNDSTESTDKKNSEQDESCFVDIGERKGERKE